MDEQGTAGPAPDLADFYRATRDPLLRTLATHGAAPHDAEDACSIAMDAAVATWPVPDPARYVRDAALAALRDMRDQERIDRGYGDEFAEPEAVEDPALSRLEGAAAVTTVLQVLPPAQRTAFSLSQLDGYGVKEIAVMLGKTPQTVRKHILLARRRLRKLFSQRSRRSLPEADPAHRHAGGSEHRRCYAGPAATRTVNRRNGSEKLS